MRNEKVESPEHYRFGGFEVIDLIRAAVAYVHDSFASTLYGNVIKYVFRWPRKDGADDLRKARWYLDALIERVEKTGGVRIPPPPEYDPASVAFRHGDPDKVCGIPNSGRSVPNSGSAHPMAAEGLRDQDETIPGCEPWWRSL